MKLLLTSSGISNPSIDDALVGLLGKPIAESSALIIPTAIYPFPDGAAGAWRAVCGKAPSPLCEVGWKSLGVLELTALPSIQEESWVPMVRETDALLVWGGDVLYLCYWMRQSGLADLLPSLSESVYVGVSAGSIVMTPYNCDAEFNLQYVPAGSDQAREGDRALVGRFRVARTSGSRGLRGLLHGKRRKVGLRNTSPDVRDRRSDRYQSGRRCGRSRLRGELETVYPRP
jgi:dipeptidase E